MPQLPTHLLAELFVDRRQWFVQQKHRRITHNGIQWMPAAPVAGQPTSVSWGTGFSAIAALRQGPDGAVYFARHAFPGSSVGGSIERIRPLGPVPEVVLIAGDGQYAAAGNAFAQPIEVEVRDATGVPIPGGPFYMLQFDLAASEDACGDFELRLNTETPDPPPLSALFNPFGGSIPVDLWQNMTIQLPPCK